MKNKNLSLKTILIIIGVGIWAIVLQNAGIIPTNQKVRVVNRVDAYVSGSVSIDNEVDVNIEAINGHSTFYRKTGDTKGKYYRIPVSN